MWPNRNVDTAMWDPSKRTKKSSIGSHTNNWMVQQCNLQNTKIWTPRFGLHTSIWRRLEGHSTERTHWAIYVKTCQGNPMHLPIIHTVGWPNMPISGLWVVSRSSTPKNLKWGGSKKKTWPIEQEEPSNTHSSCNTWSYVGMFPSVDPCWDPVVHPILFPVGNVLIADNISSMPVVFVEFSWPPHWRQHLHQRDENSKPKVSMPCSPLGRLCGWVFQHELEI